MASPPTRPRVYSRAYSNVAKPGGLSPGRYRTRRRQRPSAHFLGPGLEYQIEGRLSRSAEAVETTGRNYFPESLFPGLCTQSQAYLLGKRRRSAEERRRSVECSTDRVKIVFYLVAGEGLDDHPCPIASQGATNVGAGSNRVTHVVQAVKESYKIVVLSRIILCHRYLEFDSISDAGILGALFCRLNRLVVIVESDELGLWIGLCHQDRRSAKTAANIGHGRSLLELLFHSFESGNPRVDKVCRVSRTEKSLGTYEEVRVMFVPAQAFAGLESIGDAVLSLDGRQGDLEHARQERRTVFVR